MYYYVNHQAMREVFAPVAAETDPQLRSEILLNIQDEFAELIIEQIEKTCWELKHLRQWNTGQIADTLNISERKVKMFIRWYSERTGEWNPLDRPKPAEVIDISHLVRKRESQQSHQDSTEPTRSADEPADLVNLPTAAPASH